MNPVCMSKHPSRNNTWCDRAPGHVGPHRDSDGFAWEVAPAGSYTRTDEEDWQARAVKAVRALHTPRDEQVVSGDCSTEECDHEDGCPTVPFPVCTECARIAEEGSPYYAENGIEFVAYPCRTIRTLSAARDVGRDAR